MRTTVDINPDLAAKLREIAHEREISFKEALNVALRAGLGSDPVPRPYRVPARRLGLRPGIDLDRALHLASAIEDDEVVRKLELRK
jgi:hypothetical protein